MGDIHGFDITMDSVLWMKVIKTQRDMMRLDVSHQVQIRENLNKKSYYAQSVTVRVDLNIVPNITILQIWHHKKRPVVKLVRTEELWIPRNT